MSRHTGLHYRPHCPRGGSPGPVRKQHLHQQRLQNHCSSCQQGSHQSGCRLENLLHQRVPKVRREQCIVRRQLSSPDLDQHRRADQGTRPLLSPWSSDPLSRRKPGLKRTYRWYSGVAFPSSLHLCLPPTPCTLSQVESHGARTSTSHNCYHHEHGTPSEGVGSKPEIEKGEKRGFEHSNSSPRLPLQYLQLMVHVKYECKTSLD